MMVKKDKAFELGRQFAQHYPESLDAMKNLQNQFCNEVGSNSHNGSVCSNMSNNDTNQHKDTSESVKKSAMFYSLNFHDLTTSVTISNLTDALKLPRVSSMFPTRPRATQNKNMQQEALAFMRGVMDECTHLGNFSCPVDPTLIIIIAARNDAYVPRDSVLSLEEIWPGAEVRYIDSGHIVSFLLKQDVFR